MTAITDETWAVNGTVLTARAWSFVEFDGRFSTASVRGVDSARALGADVFQPKWVGPRTEQWRMYISQLNPDDDTAGGRAQATANLHAIKALFMGNQVVPLSLARVVSIAGMEDLLTLTAQGYVSKEPDVKTDAGGDYHEVTFTIVIPSGLWLGADNSASLSDDGTVTTAGTAQVVPSLITLTGDVTVANSTTGTGFVYTGSSCTFDPATCQTSPPDAIGGMVPTSPWPMVLAAGDNTLTVDGAEVTFDWTEAFA